MLGAYFFDSGRCLRFAAAPGTLRVAGTGGGSGRRSRPVEKFSVEREQLVAARPAFPACGKILRRAGTAGGGPAAVPGLWQNSPQSGNSQAQGVAARPAFPARGKILRRAGTASARQRPCPPAGNSTYEELALGLVRPESP